MKRSYELPALLLTLASVQQGLAQIAAYEADFSFPEAAEPPWTRVGTFDATRWLSGGLLSIDVDLGVWGPDPYGEFEGYRRTIPEFEGQNFFVEWRCRSTAPPSEIVGTGGCSLNTVGCGASYHFTITESRVRLNRGNFYPIFYFDIEPTSFHTYRIELDGAADYRVSIDGNVVDFGTPVATVPDSCGRIIWASRTYLEPSLNEWDYIRYGVIPRDRSGDYDSNGVVDATDVYYFLDCLLGPDANGPGCRWADLNGDGKVNGDDIQPFAAGLMGG